MIRPPAVAGRFYPEDPEVLGVEIDLLLASGTQQQKIRAQACLVPHAGYRYSGEVAGEVYSRMEIPARVVLLGPRHAALGRDVFGRLAHVPVLARAPKAIADQGVHRLLGCHFREELLEYCGYQFLEGPPSRSTGKSRYFLGVPSSGYST